jgi:hypothetical protein
MKYKKPLVFLLIILNLFILGGLVLAYLHKNASPTNPFLTNNIWVKKIQEEGAENAYKTLLRTYGNESSLIQHSKAHEFGAALYSVLGEKGITICDSSFGFGCYHSFFIAAISDKGQKVIPQLYETCIKAYGILGTGCQHGIGHGILEYVSPKEVLTATTLCDGIQTRTYLGCSDGVFMDYYFPLEQNASGVSVIRRNLDKKNPYFPCDQVTAKYQPSCYYELGKYLTSEPSGSSYCSGITGTEEKFACFLGFGSSVAEMKNYDIQETTATCTNSENPSVCMTGAAWSFYANPKYTAQEGTLCLSSADTQQCLEKSDLTKYHL